MTGLAASPEVLPDIILVLMLIAVILWAVVFLLRPRTPREAIVAASLSNSERLTVIEERLQHMPRQDDMQNLSTRLAGVEREVGTLTERSENTADTCGRIERSLERLTDAHLRNGK